MKGFTLAELLITVAIIAVLVGIAIIAAGVSNLMAARNMNYPKATMLGPVLTIVLGALVVFHPGFVLSTVIFLAGVALVLNGLSELELIRRVW
jgi:prepilin-type N-terminal cleavage/methylation domain-containing protein